MSWATQAAVIVCVTTKEEAEEAQRNAAFTTSKIVQHMA